MQTIRLWLEASLKTLFSSLPMLKGIWDAQTSILKTPNLETPRFQQLKVWNKDLTHLLNFLTDLKFEKKTWKSSYTKKIDQTRPAPLGRWFV